MFLQHANNLYVKYIDDRFAYPSSKCLYQQAGANKTAQELLVCCLTKPTCLLKRKPHCMQRAEVRDKQRKARNVSSSIKATCFRDACANKDCDRDFAEIMA